ncbi:MAG: RagB/SusD family nutrient uptake outer membrane protein [Butyricimonas faecalis]
MQTAHDKDKWKFIWDENMFTESESGYDAAFWQGLYEGILGCNLVLDNLDQKDGEHKLRESLRGEALTLRAWYYLHLVNFFGIAYNQGNPDTDLGVPLKLNSTVTGEFFPRNTVREVYSRIEQDLLEGNRLLTEYDYDRDYFRMGHLAAKAILSRLYLYMEEWDKALEYADAVLAQKLICWI